ncbi:MAG: hypothetical protein HN396_18605 [Gemmatimonadales bacterium]|jgi:hypothetical protein|nr:hypothetical protein [Gemmatimonadales bacterium]
MGIATHWRVDVKPPSSERDHPWIDDFGEAQRARWNEMVSQLQRLPSSNVAAEVLKQGGDEGDVRRITDCVYWTHRRDVVPIDEWYSINDRTFEVACRTLVGLGVHVSLESLTISRKQLNRLLRVHSQDLSEETLIEVIAIKTAAG